MPLAPVTPARRLGGGRRPEARRVRPGASALSTAGPYYAGTHRGAAARRAAGGRPQRQRRRAATRWPLVVTRATDGWVLLADTDGDGSLAGERPVHDYLLARETFGWAPRGRTPRVNLAANFSERGGEPVLDLVFDTRRPRHPRGRHRGGPRPLRRGRLRRRGARRAAARPQDRQQRATAASPPPAACSAAMDYAIRFAEARRLPLVLNLSFGVGNEIEGQARIDRLVDSVLARHPDVVMTISAGNDGPGLSTIGFPGQRAATRDPHRRRPIVPSRHPVGATVPPVVPRA